MAKSATHTLALSRARRVRSPGRPDTSNLMASTSTPTSELSTQTPAPDKQPSLAASPTTVAVDLSVGSRGCDLRGSGVCCCCCCCRCSRSVSRGAAIREDPGCAATAAASAAAAAAAAAASTTLPVPFYVWSCVFVLTLYLLRVFNVLRTPYMGSCTAMCCLRCFTLQCNASVWPGIS